jgi:hypothetical protein
MFVFKETMAPEFAKRYSAGRTSKLRSVAEMIPPMTTVASGRCTSAPVPVFNAMGRKPTDATKPIIRIGLSLSRAPRMIALSSDTPSRTRSRIADTMMTPVSTATPHRVMKPTPAVIDSGISRINNATTPPVTASGTPENTRAASSSHKSLARIAGGYQDACPQPPAVLKRRAFEITDIEDRLIAIAAISGLNNQPVNG